MRLTMKPRVRIAGIIVLLFIVLYTIAGFFILPPYVKKIAMEKLSELLGRRVTIESVSLNPYALSAAIVGFEIKEDDGRTMFVSFGRLYVDLKAISIFKGVPVIREVRLEQPRIHLVRTESNRYNFSDIQERLQAGQGANVAEEAREAVLFFRKQYPDHRRRHRVRRPARCDET